ncbi:MAG: nucleotidyl transferase AbiEii/AbiGii toxin family protein [Bacteroidetes bacterium]|nr:nucleotidyl transferase AbiEii/AbiGii toxin family protein [Bacteroidota bacterium]
MSAIYLHEHKDFSDLLRIIEEETGILAGLVEKDYWIMHVLYGLKKQGYDFQLKGGTSLSKGFGLIDRFSEDIDIHINPPTSLDINENPKNTNENNIKKKREYYDSLSKEIKIEGITGAERDTAFDDLKKYNSGGIRLHYQKVTDAIEGLKEGILLEVGFDTVTPNIPVTISSWAFEKAKSIADLEIIDNRAVDISCYDQRYTFVEKLQTISTKLRREMTTGTVATNYMRQYYDVYSLLGDKKVTDFIGTEEYQNHKKLRFPTEDFELPVNQNQAFLLEDADIRKRLQKRYEASKNLYYKGQPPFEEIMNRIKEYLDKL